ncbi:membrane protein [Alkalihalobacillus alcalophilus ATCC 27647 = CGMCC 1.3604]|uniref:Membrane protein n=1 Tax=Alkalihalobacillus alcalophilus ATCC 27647 = CGMCC 1.3604 TaxID=1218173 RepID=A0A094WH15_ALKAL|nr:YufK family protein [Alkalihalobacillus alcalophilus]KGA96086.1 membrane protein [Alkalihalobacillus alcalophilus ATCC 27647 = CGMCC 1.3604]MED1561083.1 YufK family protein [Alkalihalobacillus alcalophilus]THG90080.1 membrane protein [Alkalihalobacillus alcalophilus ATCC 27647 = CGMCC 1.3604]
MSNRYITSHFPLISIMLFSLSFALYVQGFILEQLVDYGLYDGMREFFSENGIKLTLLFLLVLIFFMVFSALKLIADTVFQLSMLFFSKDEEGKELIKVRTGSWIFLLCGIISLFLAYSWLWLLILFILACFIYFTYFVYKVSDSISFIGMCGMVFFHVIFWTGFLLLILYAAIKLYNSFIASLP